MIERYRVVARRILLELSELEKTVNRAERLITVEQRHLIESQ